MNKDIYGTHNVVDIDKLIINSNSRLIKSLPRFLINWIKRVVRQDELNCIHNKCKDKVGVDYINSILYQLNIDVKVHNEEVLKDVERCVFVANHPLGAIDALSYINVIHEYKGEVVSPSNQFFNYIPNLQPLVLGVNVAGKNTKEQSSAISQAFFSNKQILVFPAGIVSRKIKGEIQDIEWHKSFISKSVQSERFVVPAFFSGNNSKKFYRIARLRKFFGLKIPIEMMYLPQEMLNKKGFSIDLVFGNPLPFTFFDHSKTPVEWAQYVREYVYEIGRNFNKQS